MKKYLQIKETDRLIIRPLTKADIAHWGHFITNKKATKFFPDSMKVGLDKAEAWIDGQLKRYAEEQYGLMALVSKNSQKLIGQCGLLIQKFEQKEEVEIGYHLLPEHWGNGYATEAALFFKNFAFDEQLADSLISIIHPDNISSQKVAERNGMERNSIIQFRGMDAYVYRVFA